MPKPEMLTDDELLAIITVFTGLGLGQVRLIGASHCCADPLSTWWPASQAWNYGP
jgi:hypothetical protein